MSVLQTILFYHNFGLSRTDEVAYKMDSKALNLIQVRYITPYACKYVKENNAENGALQKRARSVIPLSVLFNFFQRLWKNIQYFQRIVRIIFICSSAKINEYENAHS